MAAILLRWTEDGGDLQLDEHRRIVVGHPLATEIFVRLNVDREPMAGDPVPEGVVRRGNWQRAFDPRAVRGSRLWMLPYVRPLARAIALAPGWADEALVDLVTSGRVVSIVNTARQLSSTAIGLEHVVQIDARTRRRFLTEVPYVL